MNSRLNYGYAVVRSAIARSLFSAGFHPTLGLHHNSQLNAFNLADNLIEPYRPAVDVLAYEIESGITLSKAERRSIARVLHSACMVGEVKTSIMTSIDLMTESLKRIVLDDSSEDLILPSIIPIMFWEGVSE